MSALCTGRYSSELPLPRDRDEVYVFPVWVRGTELAMAHASVTLQVMPDSIDVDLVDLTKRVKEVITTVYGDVGEVRVSEEPIAFGLRALRFTFVINEDMGTEVIETAIVKVPGVMNGTVVDFRRAFG